MATVAGDFFGIPAQADAEGLVRRFRRSTEGDTHWQEEFFTTGGGGAGSSHTTVFQGTSPWVVGGLTSVVPAALTTFNIGGAATVFQGTSPWVIGGNTTAVLTTASRVLSEPVLTPIGEMRTEGGTTVVSTWAGRVSSNAGTTALVTSGAGRVRVLAYSLQQTDAGSTVPQLIKFLSSNTSISGAPEWLFAQREGANMAAPTGAYLFQTNTGEALNLSLSTNVQTMAHVVVIRTS